MGFHRPRVGANPPADLVRVTHHLRLSPFSISLSSMRGVCGGLIRSYKTSQLSIFPPSHPSSCSSSL